MSTRDWLITMEGMCEKLVGNETVEAGKRSSVASLYFKNVFSGLNYKNETK